MKHIWCNFESQIFICDSLFGKKTNNFTDDQILELQDIFLTNGMHHITMCSYKEGRELIYTFLDALNCYSNIGCLTSDSASLRFDVIDIYSELFKRTNDKTINTIDLQNFLINELALNFIWIEPAIFPNTFFYTNKSFTDNLEKQHIEQQLPIFILNKLLEK